MRSVIARPQFAVGVIALAAWLVNSAPTSAFEVGAVTPVQIKLPAGAATEIPPEILPGGQRLSYFLTTDRSARCDTPATQTLRTARQIDCRAAGRSVFQLGADFLTALPAAMPAGREHRRTYYGTFSAEHARAADGTFHVVAAVHGENKNARRDGVLYPNTVLRPEDGTDGCVSGHNAAVGVYTDCYAAYSGFVGTAAVPSGARTNWGLSAPRDLGPAIWPIAGYVADRGRRRLGHGVRHPSIVRGGDGFLYLFYHDDGLLPGDRQRGFRVARARESRLGRGWRTWVAARRAWVPSLPYAGIGPESSSAALATPSPAAGSTPLFASDASVLMVARVAGRRGFVGIDQGRDYTRPCVTADGRKDWRSATRIRVSRDGVRWSAPLSPRGRDFDACDFYPNSRLTYPRFLNAAGTSTKEVDLRRFSLIGTRYGGQVWTVTMRAPELARLLPRTRRGPLSEPARAALSRGSARPRA